MDPVMNEKISVAETRYRPCVNINLYGLLDLQRIWVNDGYFVVPPGHIDPVILRVVCHIIAMAQRKTFLYFINSIIAEFSPVQPDECGQLVIVFVRKPQDENPVPQITADGLQTFVCESP